MRIVILDGHVENPGDLSWAGFEALGDLTVYDFSPPETVFDRIRGAEIVYANKTPLDAQLLARAHAEGLRYVGVLATGYNTVDTDAARALGIPVTNTPAYGTEAVAQFVFALLLEICCRAGHHAQAVQDGRWTRSRDFSFWDYPLREIGGMTLGIVGYGRIGRAVARIAEGFGMRVLAHDAHAQAEGLVSLETLYAGSDVISLHCPLTKENAGMINRRSLAQMKDGVILINTARGGLIDEPALREALLSGKAAAAGLDVVGVEPIPADHPLLGLDNCLITPHIAWAPRESRQRLMDIATENLRAYLAGRPENVVNDAADG